MASDTEKRLKRQQRKSVSVDASCLVCGRPTDADRLVIVSWRREQACCSEDCLRKHLSARRIARTRLRNRVLLATLVPALSFTAIFAVWHRFHAPSRQSISYAWPEVHWTDDVPAPVVFGPPWPPTDEQWMAVFERASWTFPLPGPARRRLNVDDRIFVPEPSRNRSPRCREDGRCGVDLGGELWGEHVYAALDGVVERVQGEGHGRPGGVCVRLSHFNGMVFTQYCHLAATPRHIGRGAHVRSGDVIALLGDTGLDGERRRLHFSMSIRPSSELQEVYWDPSALMARWPLRTPPHGTVAGLTP